MSFTAEIEKTFQHERRRYRERQDERQQVLNLQTKISYAVYAGLSKPDIDAMLEQLAALTARKRGLQ